MPVSNKKISIDFKLSTLLKIAVVCLALLLLFYIRDILLMVFVSLILASAIKPWVDWFAKNKVPRSLGILIIYLIGLWAVFMAFLLLVNPISSEIKNLSDDFPTYWQNISSGWSNVESFSQSHGLKQNIEDALSAMQAGLTSLATNLVGGLVSFIGGIFSLLVILVMTFYLAVYDRQMKTVARNLLPAKHRDYFDHLIDRMQEKIGLWLRGQLLLCLIIFIMSLVGLLVLGVKYAWVLALIAGLTEIIPYLGPFMAGVPAVFIGFTQSPWLGLAVLILFIIVQQAENYFITPQIMRKAIGLNPVITIIVMMIGFKLSGLMGIILSVPVATAIGVGLGDYLEHRRIK
ncbi:MAG: AI-2E family transporter [Patescibacteria group bacterium]|jgi:predicted PurR-regulated permease PerM